MKFCYSRGKWIRFRGYCELDVQSESFSMVQSRSHNHYFLPLLPGDARARSTLLSVGVMTAHGTLKPHWWQWLISQICVLLLLLLLFHEVDKMGGTKEKTEDGMLWKETEGRIFCAIVFSVNIFFENEKWNPTQSKPRGNSLHRHFNLGRSELFDSLSVGYAWYLLFRFAKR